MLTAPTPLPLPPPLTHAHTPLPPHVRSHARPKHATATAHLHTAATAACPTASHTLVPARPHSHLPAPACPHLHAAACTHATTATAPSTVILHPATRICTSLLPSARHTLAYVPGTRAVPAARGSNIRQCGGRDLLGGSEATGWQKYVRILGEQKIVIGRKGTHTLEGVAAMAAATWANDD
jgi:hypothetical protein